MKKGLLLLSILLVTNMAWGVENSLDQGKINLKAGPTEPGEKLSLVWVESFIFPKVIKDEKIISLGVRTTAKVSAVTATFDFKAKPVQLSSNDSLSWSGVLEIPAGVTGGVHVARYLIAGKNGSIQRTVEFFVGTLPDLANKTVTSETVAQVSTGDAVPVPGWPLTITASGSALVGNKLLPINAGQRLIGLSKVHWYKVLFSDGQEGWVSATMVSEPAEDLFNHGLADFQKNDYASAVEKFRSAVEINSEYVHAYEWLAKSYLALGQLESASAAVRKAIHLDDRDIESKVVAADLAQKFSELAHNRFRARRYQEAVTAYRKALELKPNSIASWLELGQSLQRLGLRPEARGAWREALRYDPENQTLLALTRTEKKSETSVVALSKHDIAATLADDSLKIVKEEKTKKGTKIESAIKSVVALTKSLGTPVLEKGWQIRKQGEKLLVSYLCRQSVGVVESFDWLVDVDTRQARPNNDNARLLVSRW